MVWASHLPISQTFYIDEKDFLRSNFALLDPYIFPTKFFYSGHSKGINRVFKQRSDRGIGGN